jgi:hypothetical protein
MYRRLDSGLGLSAASGMIPRIFNAADYQKKVNFLSKS